MKRFLASILIILCLGITSKAQVIILNDNVMTGRMSEIKTTVLDSLTNEPVGFASVYVIPSGKGVWIWARSGCRWTNSSSRRRR